MKSRFCELLGIKYPVIQGGMVHISTWELVSAVSEAGGLGIIGSGNYSASWVREQIRRVRAKTDKPFGVNLVVFSPYLEEVIRTVIEEGVRIVTIGGGVARRLISLLKQKGIIVIPVVGSVKYAILCERLGADAVIAEGMESGGEIGEVSTMALVPQVVKSVKIPVAAAGGIADGRGAAAAFLLGAEAIQMGTRFIVSHECIAHEKFKNVILKSRDTDTVVIGNFSGVRLRVIKNSFCMEVLEREREYLKADPAERAEIKKEIINLCMGRSYKALIEGDIENGALIAGQSVGLIDHIIPAGDIVLKTIEEMKESFVRSHFAFC